MLTRRTLQRNGVATRPQLLQHLLLSTGMRGSNRRRVSATLVATTPLGRCHDGQLRAQNGRPLKNCLPMWEEVCHHHQEVGAGVLSCWQTVVGQGTKHPPPPGQKPRQDKNNIGAGKLFESQRKAMAGFGLGRKSATTAATRRWPTLERPTLARPTMARPTLERPTLERPTLARPTKIWQEQPGQLGETRRRIFKSC